MIISSTFAEFIKWWINEKATNGYQTIALGSEPGIGAISFWLMTHILQGEKVPEMIQHPYELPLVALTNATVDSSRTSSRE